MRVLTRDLEEHIGKTVVLKGWLHKKRLLGGLTFVVLRDRGGVAQILVKEKQEVEKLREHQNGSILTIKGKVVADERAAGGVEIHDAVVTVEIAVLEQPPIEIDKPISHKPDNLETLFDNRPLALRNVQETAIFKVQAKVLEGFREFFKQNDFTEMNSPKLLAEATEGGAEVFKLDYFGKTATLAQSAQFYKQIMVGVFERVFETNPTYRAEPSSTTRHMTEYITIDAEMGFIDFPTLLDTAGDCLVSVINYVEKECAAELKVWDVKPFVLPKAGKDVPRLSIHEIHEKFLKATKEDHSGEGDLAPSEERWICEWAKKELGSEAVLVVGWPRYDKTFKFYHRADAEHPEIAERADLLFRGVEIATASMRENRYGKLIEQLQDSGYDPTNPGYAPLLSAYRHGMPPHGGWGWGLERTVQKILGLQNVKEATLFPRDINRLTP
jgi:nondiscriminating aspartyl-tRNA synthetase